MLGFAKELVEAEVLDPALDQQPVVDHPGAEQGGEEIEDDAQAQGDGEALDGAGAEEEQDHRGDQGGDVGVDDGPEGLVIAAVDAGLQGLAGMELLPHSFINQDVGVHRHARPTG